MNVHKLGGYIDLGRMGELPLYLYLKVFSLRMLRSSAPKAEEALGNPLVLQL